jgi:hypothetical protein
MDLTFLRESSVSDLVASYESEAKQSANNDGPNKDEKMTKEREEQPQRCWNIFCAQPIQSSTAFHPNNNWCITCVAHQWSRLKSCVRRLHFSDKSCAHCGITDARVSDNDHLDPTEKLTTGSGNKVRAIAHVPLKKIVAELKKTQVLCTRCHAIVTHHQKQREMKEDVDDRIKKLRQDRQALGEKVEQIKLQIG